MNLPARNRHWKKEIEKALAAAEKRAQRESVELKYIYKYAPDYIAINRSLSDPALLKHIEDDIQDRVYHDWNVDERSYLNHKFHFASSYIFGHVAAGLMDEMDGDKVMDYINQNIDLFDAEYDYD